MAPENAGRPLDAPGSAGISKKADLRVCQGNLVILGLRPDPGAGGKKLATTPPPPRGGVRAGLWQLPTANVFEKPKHACAKGAERVKQGGVANTVPFY